MSLTFQRGSLLDALNVVNAAVEKKTTIPVLAFVLLEGKGDRVQITGMDIERAISLSIDGLGEGSLCLPATQFRDLVKLASGEIRVSAQGVVTGEGFTAKLPIAERTGFPECPVVKGSGAKLNGANFAEMLKRVRFASEQDANVNGKWCFQAILFRIKDSTLTLAASNEKHLAVASATIKSEADAEYLIPQLSVKALSAFAANYDEVELAGAENHFGLIGENGSISTRLLSGKFPDYTIAIPKDWPHVITIPRDEFTTTLRHASLALDRTVGSRWEISKDKLTISARSSERGESERSMPINCGSLNGKSEVLGLNAPQVLTYLGTASDEVEFSFIDSARPFRFRAKTDGFDFVYYSMAMRPDSF